MGYGNVDNNDDLSKLYKSFAVLTRMFSSIEQLLDAFGILHLPIAQRYGILFGVIVFVGTVISVLFLLTFGGSFQRIQQQELAIANGIDPNQLSASEIRKRRLLLLEELLDGRIRMQQKYQKEYTVLRTSDSNSPLTKLLLNVAPTNMPKKEKDLDDLLLNEQNDEDSNKKDPTIVPDRFIENYVEAYRDCQDKPGGPLLDGCPEARYEAYARAYAGCGPYCNKTYRRSYGRIYEALVCQNHIVNEKYTKLYETRPYDIIGQHVRLEVLTIERHAQSLYTLLSGTVGLENKSFDPNDVWGFLPGGPFENVTQLSQSFVFQRKYNEAGFAIINNLNDRIIGCVLLTNDDPIHLSIQLELPIVQPKKENTHYQIETCFLLMDRLFANGYQRIQISMDAQEFHTSTTSKRKLCIKLGYSYEATLHKHMIVKDSSRDSIIYGIIHTDWERSGVRKRLLEQLYNISSSPSIQQGIEKTNTEHVK